MTYRNCFFYAPLLAGCIGCAASCANLASCALPDTGRVTLMSYNAQTFFDAEECGSEFEEFKGGKSAWSEERYIERLERLKDAIVLSGEESGMCPGAGPDIVVLLEIENEGVLRDIGGRFSSFGAYPYAVFAPQENGGAFSIGILSRFPVVSVRTHQTFSGGVFLRPLVETVLDVRGRELTVFSAHWKSKAGDGGDVSSLLRRAQEELLDKKIRLLEEGSPGALWIACGDFNQRLEEFSALSRFANGWESPLTSGSLSHSAAGGSYCYQGRWEEIDHIFVPDSLVDGTGIEAGGFAPVSGGKLVGSSGEPAGYEVFSGKGYSDHLPVVIAIEAWD